MPPPYDNIASAFPLIQDGTDHTVDIDNAGATMETNESTFGEGFAGVWLKVDLSDPGYAVVYGDFVPFTLASVVLSSSTGTLHPYIDPQTDTPGGATFDPSSPDWSEMSFPGPSLGDGTSTPPPVIDSFQLSDSETGIFYLFVGDSSGTNEGIQRITYNIPAVPVIFDVDVSDYNNVSGTVSIPVAGTIRETQALPNDYSIDTRGAIDTVYTFKIPSGQLPDNGRYHVYLKGQIRASSAWSGFNEWNVLIRRNGEPLFPVSLLHAHSGGGNPSANNFWKLTGEVEGFDAILAGGLRRYKQGHGPTTIPILAGDEISFAVYSDDPNNLSASPVTQFDITGASFVQVEAGGHGSTIQLADIDRLPLTYSVDGRDDPTNEDRVDQVDMCILDNGDIYVFYKAHKNSNGAQYLKLRKYSGGSWSTVSNDVSSAGYGPGILTAEYGQISMDSDGTNLWLAWGESDSSTSKVLTHSNGSTGIFHPMLWHCKRYVPGTGFTELGTGQCKIPIASRTKTSVTNGYAPDAGDYGTSIKIKIAPNGIPWVAWGESDDAFYGAGTPDAFNTRVYVSYWDGSAWQETGFPNHPNVDLVTSHEGAYLNWIDVDAQHDIDLTFCQHNGPSNYPSVIYCLGSQDTGRGHVNQRFIYREYNGSSWGNLIDALPQEIWPGTFYAARYNPTDTGGSGQQGMALENDGTTPIFAAALWNAFYSDKIKVAKVSADGSALVEYSGTNLFSRSADTGWTDNRNASTPAQGGGGWFDPTGCDMAIGPDGKPWVIYTGTWFQEYGVQVFRYGELGTDDGWIIGSRLNGMLLGENSLSFARIKIKGNFLYVLAEFGEFTGISGIDYLGVYKAPINDPYTVWVSGAAGASILYYFKDGAWHQAGSETTQDLYYFKDGAWHRKGSEATQTLKAQYTGLWAD